VKFATQTFSAAAARIKNARLTATTVSVNTDVSANTIKTVFTEMSTKTIQLAKYFANIPGQKDVLKIKSLFTTFADGTKKTPAMDLATGVLDLEKAPVKAQAIPSSIFAIAKTKPDASKSSASFLLASTTTTIEHAAFATKEHTFQRRMKLASLLRTNVLLMPIVMIA